MAKKNTSQNWDFKATKMLLQEYLAKGIEKKDINLPENTIKIDDLNRKETL